MKRALTRGFPGRVTVSRGQLHELEVRWDASEKELVPVRTPPMAEPVVVGLPLETLSGQSQQLQKAGGLGMAGNGVVF